MSQQHRFPHTQKQFQETFPRWPKDSLKDEDISISSGGSNWDRKEIRIFQVLRSRPNRFSPDFLDSFQQAACLEVTQSSEISELLEIVGKKKYLSWPQEEFPAGPFHSFLILLSQVVESNPEMPSTRQTRSQSNPQPSNDVYSDPISSSNQEGPIIPSSPLWLEIDRERDVSSPATQPRAPGFIKRTRSSSSLEDSSQSHTKRPRYGGSFDAKDEKEQEVPSLQETSYSQAEYSATVSSDQDALTNRSKSEVGTNSCGYELLRSVTELARSSSRATKDNNKRSKRTVGLKDEWRTERLEWNVAFDTIRCGDLGAGNKRFSTTNDGSLVPKGLVSGFWQRVSWECVCSLEAKAKHSTSGKSWSVIGQEASHLIAMYWVNAQEIGTNTDTPKIVPLISIAQNYFSLVYAVFPPQYLEYLRSGDQSEEGVFVEVKEYGPFNMTSRDDMARILEIIVALHQWAENEFIQGAEK